ncbi:hypothetical protein GCM10023149_07700 [Mucilaginibacter gynuensis]|uniref:FAS1 domain-containing protein n=1 Tax=Mucilaginibacter gynuensis TaxID=1302236 RepID=A0ABP8FWB0_9SPHI
MKKKLLYINFALAVLGISLTLTLSGCLKASDAQLNPEPALPFKGDNLVKTLAGQSSLHLFYQAFNRLKLAASIDSSKAYTIFAPTDSAMMAAGLDEAGINQLDIDSLRKLITYQIGIGALDERALSNSVVTPQIITLKKDPVKDPSTGTIYQRSPILFVKQTGAIYFNGVPLNKSAPVIPATNGYLYPVSGFIAQIPAPTLYDIIKTDPELSMYYKALMIEDSVLVANSGGGDIAFFSAPGSIYRTNGMYPTILAPTNKAFNDAGFYTAEDIVKYADSGPYIGPDFNDFITFHYSPLDTVLRHHVLYSPLGASDGSNGLSIYAVRVFYNDMLNTAINNGVYNTWGKALPGFPTYYSMNFPVPLTFSSVGQTAYVKWSNNAAAPAVEIPRDASAQHPVNNYVASNGALYKIDKLFYPAVK